MAMLAMAFAFSSCGDDDDDDIVGGGGGSSTNIKEVRALYFYDNGSQYLNRQYKLTIGSETITLKLDELKKEAGMPEKIQKLESAKSAESEAKKDGEAINIYSYEIPADKHGAVTVNADYSVKDAANLPDEVSVLMGVFTYIGKENDPEISGKVVYSAGVAKASMQDYLNIRNSSITANGNVK